ncbi:MAG: glycerol-3-phosphate 1-O-acyltransferase PlsY [Armatimonadetes bacterium]|nr:glycerol-3-phosphate 1-O-acyltransferase PlsY [Armatimonadota bacterium]
MISYLIGAVPIGYLVARAKGIDIRRRGSGNIGTTNVWRNLGPAAGILVLAGDVLKGVLAVLLGRYLAGGDAQLLTALAALVGHSWSVFLGFQGGKIIATTLGVFLLLDPLAMLIGLGIWLAVVGVSRYVSLGSITAVAALPVLMLVLGRSWTHLLFALAVAAIAVYKHLPNIRRLLSGTESRIGRL